MGDLWNNSTFFCDGYIVVQGDIYTSQNFISAGYPASGDTYNSESIFESLSTFQSYFGLNSWQDTDFIYINKADLPRLTPNNSNTAESLFIGILNNILNNTDEYSGTVNAFFWRANKESKKLQFVLNFYFPVPTGEDGQIGDYADDLNPMEI